MYVSVLIRLSVKFQNIHSFVCRFFSLWIFIELSPQSKILVLKGAAPFRICLRARRQVYMRLRLFLSLAQRLTSFY